MKTVTFLFLSLALMSAPGAEVSLQEFENIRSSQERLKMIAQAPPDQQEQLRKIDRHLHLISAYGEAGLRKMIESEVVIARGFGKMERAFQSHALLWESYMSHVLEANRKSGMSEDKQESEYKELKALYDANIQQRLTVVHDLIFALAPSRAALDLESRVQKFDELLNDRYGVEGGKMDGKSSVQPTTWAEIEDIDRHFNEFFNELKQLPKLDPAEAKKEYDEYPESNLPHLLKPSAD